MEWAALWSFSRLNDLAEEFNIRHEGRGHCLKTEEEDGVTLCHVFVLKCSTGGLLCLLSDSTMTLSLAEVTLNST